MATHILSSRLRDNLHVFTVVFSIYKKKKSQRSPSVNIFTLHATDAQHLLFIRATQNANGKKRDDSNEHRNT